MRRCFKIDLLTVLFGISPLFPIILSFFFFFGLLTHVLQSLCKRLLARIFEILLFLLHFCCCRWRRWNKWPDDDPPICVWECDDGVTTVATQKPNGQWDHFNFSLLFAHCTVCKSLSLNVVNWKKSNKFCMTAWLWAKPTHSKIFDDIQIREISSKS